jgi:hypothetical protein
VTCNWTDYLDSGVSLALSLVIALSVVPLLRRGNFLFPPLNYSGNPEVHDESDRGANWNARARGPHPARLQPP